MPAPVNTTRDYAQGISMRSIKEIDKLLLAFSTCHLRATPNLLCVDTTAGTWTSLTVHFFVLIGLFVLAK